MSEPLARLAFNGVSLEKLLIISPEVAEGMIDELLGQALALHGKLPARVTLVLQLEEYEEDGEENTGD